MIPKMTQNEYNSFLRKLSSVTLRTSYLRNESKYNLIRFILHHITDCNEYEYYLRTSTKREIISIINKTIN